MRVPLQFCSRRSVVAVLASGAVISMSALTGGVAPAFAKPDHGDPVVPVLPTTEVAAPEAPRGQAPEAAHDQAPETPPTVPAQQAPAPPRGPSVAEVPQAPVPQSQAPAPQPQTQVEAPVPQVFAPAPPKHDSRAVDDPKTDAPTADTPPVQAPKTVPPKEDPVAADTPRVDNPNTDGPVVEAPKTGQSPATPADGTPPDAALDQQDGAKPPQNPGRPAEATGGDAVTPGEKTPPAAGQPGSDGSDNDPSAAAKPALRIPTAQPETLQAPDQDVALARSAKPVELKPEPAAKGDVDFLSSAINVSSRTQLGPFQSEFNAGSDFSIGGKRDREHDWVWDKKQWDHTVRQWNRNWIEYDDWYRPVIFNPYRAPVRIVYVYQYAPRIVIVPPLGRVLVDAAEMAAYSFTAVVLNAANLAADVAVGTFFGGGYLPPIGAPFTPPPPLLRYDNVPVQVRYSNATYEPFRVRQIVDVGDDVRYGGRKVLLDGSTPAWGQWTTSPTGERQFEVHRTQQFPGLGDPQEAPLPGDYRMRLASDESTQTDHAQMYLLAAAGVVAGLGFAALGAAFYLGRRRPQL